jgi:hypothetical protein
MKILQNEINKTKLQTKIKKYLKVNVTNWELPDEKNFKIKIFSDGATYELQKVNAIQEEMGGLVQFKTFNNELWAYLKICNDEEEEEEKNNNSFPVYCIASFLLCFVVFGFFMWLGFFTSTNEHYLELIKTELVYATLIKNYGYLRTTWIVITHAVAHSLF